ncbi:RIB43A-like with coiled-coils protein 1 [Corythoichthys intestinalis]|uniref:RIB43A-like with coiled-coils protein 1 n=1 Tax=Corythoichthys intestinalis TaxID=161448 RepID=UPI0025A688BC|nr:RIB43A-like with coiled-coils protein 1 [Corythoichthys intestinalis]
MTTSFDFKEKIYKVKFPLDHSFETPVERRQAAEAARKVRVFNVRQRVMGLDLDALNQQTQEKKHREKMERERDKVYDELRLKHDEKLIQKDREERKLREALHTDLTQYWSIQQRVEDSRDADLKCSLRGAFSINLTEPELGPSSMQIFQGEDIGEAQRKREQMKQTEGDLLAQMEQNERRCMKEKHREMLAEKELLQQDIRWKQRHQAEEESKKAARVALDHYNQALATEQTETRKEAHGDEERETLAEKWHILTSAMITEGWDTAVKQLKEGKPAATDEWRGMSPEQLSAIYKEREEQCIERQRQRDIEKNQEAAWNSQILKASGEARQEETRTSDLRRAKRIQADQFNTQLAKEQQAHQQYLNKELYTNKPTQDYFRQFNTTSR